MINEVENLVKVCHELNRPDWVQGGGGNVSVKLDDQKMLIKASGFAFKDIKEETGLAEVNYPAIMNFYEELDSASKTENEVTDFVLKHVYAGSKLRPSIEVGFHTFLGKYVLHTHSVYVNLLSCSTQGKEVVEKLLTTKDLELVWVPYANPGFNLTISVREEIKNKLGKNKVIILQNHGVIVSSNDLHECLKIYIDVDKILTNYFKPAKYPHPEVVRIEAGFQSTTRWLKDNLINFSTLSNFSGILFPDQIVYLNNNICFCDGCEKKVHIKNSQVYYNCSEKEALVIEETLVSYVYILKTMKANGLVPSFIPEEGVKYVENMESEKYRVALLAK